MTFMPTYRENLGAREREGCAFQEYCRNKGKGTVELFRFDQGREDLGRIFPPYGVFLLLT